ncbi:MAG: helix-turn-helix domain-containing protein [Waddliaceae bacterium]
MTQETLSSRLRKIIEEKFDGVDRRYAIAAGVNSATLQTYLDRGSKPGFEIAMKLASAGGVTVEWLLTGKDPKEKGMENPLVSEDSPGYRTDIKGKKHLAITTKDERRLINAYRKADNRAKKDAILLLERHRKLG